MMECLSLCECGRKPELRWCDNDVRFMYCKEGNVQYAYFCECGEVGFQGPTKEIALRRWNRRKKYRKGGDVKGPRATLVRRVYQGDRYRCEDCGRVIKGVYRDTPSRGSYMRAVCVCGNKGSSDWYYDIPGFARVDEGERDSTKGSNHG